MDKGEMKLNFNTWFAIEVFVESGRNNIVLRY